MHQVRHRIGVAIRQRPWPLLEQSAQEGIYQAGSSRRQTFGEFNGSMHGGMRRNAGLQYLIGPQTQQVEHLRFEITECAIDVRRQEPIKTGAQTYGCTSSAR